MLKQINKSVMDVRSPETRSNDPPANHLSGQWCPNQESATKEPCREPVTSQKRCRLWLPGVPSPFLKVELWPGGNTDFFQEKKNLYFYLNSYIFKTQQGSHMWWPVCSLWSQCSQTGWSHGQLEVPGTGWLLLSPCQNSLDPSAWSHSDMTSCMTCVFAVSAPHCRLTKMAQALPVQTYPRCQERNTLAPHWPSPAPAGSDWRRQPPRNEGDPPGMGAAMCQAPLPALCPRSAG